MVRKMLSRVLRWGLRLGSLRLLRIALDRGGPSALNTALGTAASLVPRPSDRMLSQVFLANSPITVYLRASHCRVILRTTPEPRVTLETTQHPILGPELTTEQDAAGVYIVARRRPVVGTTTRAELTLTVPRDAHLALHLTPGEMVLEGIDGLVDLPASTVFPAAQAVQTQAK